MKKLARYFVGVKKEMKKVRWPKRKEMVTYSSATILFIIIFALFFTLSDLIISGIQVLFK